MDWSKIEHFNPATDTMLACPSTGECDMDEAFMLRLDHARELADTPFVITSGYRNRDYNATLKGSVSGSAHILGLAVDIAFKSSAQCFAIVNALLEAGFVRIGIGPDFIHVDDDMNKPNPVMWGYYNHA